MKYAFSTIEIKSASDANGARTFEGIASTPSTDRMGDIVEPMGAQFTLPIPLLWQHNAKDPIGWITAAVPSKDGIRVKGEIASIPDPGPLQDRLTLAWQYLKNKLVRGLSIGFNPIESADMKGTWGVHFTKWEWLELSAVTIPANQDASITAVRSIATKELAALGRSSPGDSGKPKPKGTKMNLREKLDGLKSARAEKSARMDELIQLRTSEDRASTEDEAAEFDTLHDEVVKMDDEIRTVSYQVMQAASARGVPSDPDGSRASRGAPAYIKSRDPEDSFKGQSYTRIVIAKALAHLLGGMASGHAQARWGKSSPGLIKLIKANEVAGGSSITGEWGAELVALDGRYTGDFIEFLTSRTVFDRLPLRQVPANVTIKGGDGAATGYWVGEGRSIPVSEQDYSTVNLTNLKVAALSVISNELLMDSSPSAEMLVRDRLVDASTQRVDTTFISASAAVAGVSPGGVLHGLVAKSASGTDGDAVRTDIQSLYSGFLAAKNASGLWWAMNPALAKAMSLMRNTLGVKEFPDIRADGGMLEGDNVVTGDNVAGSYIVLLKPSDIYRIGDTGVQVSVSKDAMIEMSSDPTGNSDSPATASQAMVSMFQSENTAIKVVRRINFALRRASAVAFINDADYNHGSTS